jgi:hypothetical protein
MRRQFGRDDRRVAMDLGRAWRDQPDDPLDLGASSRTSVSTRPSPRIDAQRTVGIDHDLDDARIGQRGGDRRPHGGAQHGAAALGRTVSAPVGITTCLHRFGRVRRARAWRSAGRPGRRRLETVAPDRAAAASASGSGAVTVSW